MAGISASKIAGLSSAERRPQAGIAVIILLGLAWTILAAIQRDELYDGLAVVSSTLALVSALAFFAWQAPPGRSTFRLLGIFVSAQTFLSSGLSIIRKVDTGALPSVPSESAFSFAVESSVAFAGAFLLGAFLTSPRATKTAEPPDVDAVGLTPFVALGLSIIASLLVVQGALTATIDNVSRLGTLPQLVFNATLISSMLTATWLITKRSTWLPLAIMLLGHFFITFYTSMLGVVVFAIRDIVLAYIFLGKKIPKLLLIAVVGGVLLFNPVKMLFREQIADRRSTGSALTFDQAVAFWGEGVDEVWTGTNGRAGPEHSALDSAASRLDYNWVAAHIHATVGRRIPYEMGATYEDIPMMFVPRVLYPNKPTSFGYTRTRWLIKLGLVTRRSAERVAFAVPASAEAYWNFGWPGVFAVGGLLGVAVGGLLRMAPRDPVARTGFAVTLVVSLGQFLDMLVWVIPLFGSVALAGVLSYLFCRLGRLRIRTRSAAAAPGLVRGGDGAHV